MRVDAGSELVECSTGQLHVWRGRAGQEVQDKSRSVSGARGDCRFTTGSTWLTISMCADNLSTPLAATLGDLITLTILAGVARFWRLFVGSLASTLVLVLLLAAIAVNVVITFKNAYVQELLTIGFGPLLIAMAISSGTGVVLETYVNAYQGFALLATVLTALSGGAGSVFCSRLGTALHSGKREHYWLTAVTLGSLTGVVMVICLVGMVGVGAIGGGVGVAVGVVTLGIQVSCCRWSG